jgi:hypothetical protein
MHLRNLAKTLIDGNNFSTNYQKLSLAPGKAFLGAGGGVTRT